MMETKRLTYKEWQLLSDFLDGQLAENKKQAVLQRLQTDEFFSAAYQQLKWSRGLLRQAPHRKVPHNFVLSRQMAAEARTTGRKRFPLLNGMFSGIAALVFVVLLGVRVLPMLGFGAKTAAMAPMNAADYQVAEDVVAEEAVAMEMMAEPALMEEAALAESPESADAGELMMQADAPEARTALPTESAATVSPEEASGGGGIPSTATSIPSTATAYPTLEPTMNPVSESAAGKMDEESTATEQVGLSDSTIPLEREDTGTIEGSSREFTEPSFPWESLLWNIGIVGSAVLAILFFALGFIQRKQK